MNNNPRGMMALIDFVLEALKILEEKIFPGVFFIKPTMSLRFTGITQFDCRSSRLE